jgi:hypothetical protein
MVQTSEVSLVPQNVFDKASRFTAKLDPPGFLSWLLGLPAEAFAFRGWLDTRGIPFPGDADRTGDTVAHLGDLGEHGIPWAVAVEFQAEPDPLMFGRLLGYVSGLWMSLKPDEERGSRFSLGAAVVNLTGTGRASRQMRWSAAGMGMQFDVVDRNLEREPAEELLLGIEAGRWSRCMLPWVPLMQGGDDPGLVDRWKLLAEAEPDSRRRSEYAGLALVFADRAKRKDFWKQKLKGWNMTESSVVNEWIAEGEAKGEAKGRAEGRAEGVRSSIITFGTKRFGCKPTDAQRAALDTIRDLDALTRLNERVLDVASWEELLAGP